MPFPRSAAALPAAGAASATRRPIVTARIAYRATAPLTMPIPARIPGEPIVNISASGSCRLPARRSLDGVWEVSPVPGLGPRRGRGHRRRHGAPRPDAGCPRSRRLRSLLGRPGDAPAVDPAGPPPCAAAPAGPDYPGALWEPANPRNYTVADRPYTNRVTRIIIHVAEGGWASTYTWFRNAAAEASANYVVSSTGRVAQMVPDRDIAWHAGNWAYNESSVGIEHAGFTERHPLPRRPVPRIGQAGGLDRGHLPDHARPPACHRPLPGARPGPPRRVGRRRPPHRSRPHLELAAVHGLSAGRRARHPPAGGRQRRCHRRELRPRGLARPNGADGPLRAQLPRGGPRTVEQPRQVPAGGSGDRPLRPDDALAVRGRLGAGRRQRPRDSWPAQHHRRRGPRLRPVPVRRQL